ncbi:MAG: DEAD/DEAH box helicase [Chrysiogenales bacterium]|nr:MAG: DEAD/DEAH box helicase [Chrysiogenales bacterium]
MIALNNFSRFDLSEQIMKGVAGKGFEEPTLIQEKIIPLFLSGEKDIVGQALTGTGKTAAFGIHLLEILREKAGFLQALVLVPTRELAIQVSEELNSLKGTKKLHIIPVYGGQSMEDQLRKLKQGVDIVVGTVGRVLDHIRRHTIDPAKLTHVILDEADEMLNMGFIDDIELILGKTSPEKRMLLFSATMPGRILSIAKKFMRQYESVTIGNKQLTVNLTDQIYFEVNESDKFEALCRIIDIENAFYGLVFCRTKIDVDKVCSKLLDRGYDADGIHGDIPQAQREKTLKSFRSGRVNVLVATDVAARGIDVSNLTHVINFSLPQDPDSYIHRIGRTGRAGREGTAITFITPSEYRKLVIIKKITGSEIRREKLPKVKDIISIKSDRLVKEIRSIIGKSEAVAHTAIASSLLADNNPEEVISALIQHFFKDELDVNNYNDIKEIRDNVDKKGTARLFIALGKNDRMHPVKLVNLLKKEVKLTDRQIQDVKVFEKYSLITVAFADAERIIKVFKPHGKGKRPMAKIASGTNKTH